MTESKIVKLHSMLEKKEISCRELTQSYIDAIEKDNTQLNAYVTATPDEALKTAGKVDEKIAQGKDIGLLEGIPMTLKDNISTDGIRTTCCSKILEDYVPIYDATVWKILKAQNAVLLGKTNMDEFAMGSSCETSYFGGAKNPHNINHVAGGSSGGVASAVGGNIAVYGLGSDTGGSIRQPASFCGIVGLKPTYGAVSRYGLIAYASSFDQIGPITTSVEDAAIVFDAVSEYDTMDSTSQGRKGAPVCETLRNDIKGMKIGIAREYLDGVRDDVRKAVEIAQKQMLKELGYNCTEYEIFEKKLRKLGTAIDVMEKKLKRHEYTFGNNENGYDKILTGKADMNSKQTLDYIWEIIPDFSLPIYNHGMNKLNKNYSYDDKNCENHKIKVLYDTFEVQHFLAKNRPYQQLSDHFGISVDLSTSKNQSLNNSFNEETELPLKNN